MAVDVWYNDGGPTPLLQAIGGENALLQLVVLPHLYGQFETDLASEGVSSAEEHVITLAAQECQSASNPLLTQGQLQSLQQLATGSDVSSLSEVTHFATLPTSGPS